MIITRIATPRLSFCQGVTVSSVLVILVSHRAQGTSNTNTMIRWIVSLQELVLGQVQLLILI